MTQFSRWPFKTPRPARPGKKILFVFALLIAATSSVANAQNVPSAPAEPTTPPAASTSQVYRTTDSRVAIGRSIRVERDEEVSDAVVVIGGSLRVDGRVRGDVVCIGGTIELGPQAEVRGDVVAVGGGVRRDPGARLYGSVSDVSFGDWGTWTFGGFVLPTIDFGDFGRWLSLVGAVFRISFLAVLMAMLLLLARAPVARVGRAAGAEPGRAFLLGLAAEILFLPALIILAVGLIVTIIGIPLLVILLPVAFLAAFLALILGFTGIACRVGEWVQDRLGWTSKSAFLSTAIGFLLIVSPIMLSRMIGVAPDPLRTVAFTLMVSGLVLEYVVWTVGLGATLRTGFGRWSMAPPPVPPAPQPGIVQVAS